MRIAFAATLAAFAVHMTQPAEAATLLSTVEEADWVDEAPDMLAETDQRRTSSS